MGAPDNIDLSPAEARAYIECRDSMSTFDTVLDLTPECQENAQKVLTALGFESAYEYAERASEISKELCEVRRST